MFKKIEEVMNRAKGKPEKEVPPEIETVHSEEELMAAAKKCDSFETLKQLVSQYNSLFDEQLRRGRSAEEYGGEATIDARRDKVIARVEFKDCDAWIVQRNRITELRKKPKMKPGDVVAININIPGNTRATESIGWKILSIDNNNFVTLTRGGKTERVRYDSLLEANTSAGFTLPSSILTV